MILAIKIKIFMLEKKNIWFGQYFRYPIFVYRFC
jgi:hypothetical protein